MGSSVLGLGVAGGLLTGSIWILLIAALATAAVFIFFMRTSKSQEYRGFARWLYDFLDFRQLWLGKILKILFLFVSIYLICTGVYVMFSSSFLMGLLTMVLGPVLARIIMELVLLLFSIQQEVKQLNSHIRGEAPDKDEPRADFAPPRSDFAPKPQRRAEYPTPAPTYAPPVGEAPQASRRTHQAQVTWQPQQPQQQPPQQPSQRYAPPPMPPQDNPYRAPQQDNPYRQPQPPQDDPYRQPSQRQPRTQRQQD